MEQSLLKFTEWLNNNQWLNLIFLLLAILSIIVSFILYLKSIKTKKPTYLIKSFNLVKENISKIEQVKIFYDETIINNLTVSKISIWNKGKETINNYDIAPKDKIRIDCINCKILKANIIYQKKLANNFSININKFQNSLRIDFDYFHYNEGIVIELYHTGTSSQDIKIKGTIKGVKKFQKGDIEEDFLLNLYVDKILVKVKNIKTNIFFKMILLSIFFIISIPVVMILTPISNIYKLTKFIPSEFKLND